MRASHLRIFAAGLCLLFATGCASTATTESLKQTFDSGVVAYDAGHYDEAYKTWSSIQDQDLAAMRNLGLMLRKGQGVAKNPQAAEQMLYRAAEAGLPNAEADLGEMLLKGEAAPPDPKAALPWLAAAAAADHPIAEFELAGLYEQGLAVPKNLDTARQLYAAAAHQGMKDAQARLEALPPDPSVTGAPRKLRPSRPAN